MQTSKKTTEQSTVNIIILTTNQNITDILINMLEKTPEVFPNWQRVAVFTHRIEEGIWQNIVAYKLVIINDYTTNRNSKKVNAIIEAITKKANYKKPAVINFKIGKKEFGGLVFRKRITSITLKNLQNIK